MMYLQKNNYRLWFDRFFPTKGGYLSGVTIYPAKNIATQKETIIHLVRGYSIVSNKLHGIFHVGNVCLKKTAKNYDWKLQGIMQKCKECAKSKARCKNIAKETEDKSQKPGERLCFDISSVKSTSFSGSKF